MIRYAVLAKESASVLCDEDIVLYTYASEVLVGLNLVEVEEFGALS